MGQQDHQRALNPRGRHDAPRMAAWLAERYGVPDIILASTAVRVQETVALMMATWNENPPVINNDHLYLAAPDTILKWIRSDAYTGSTLLLVAHNPGLQELISNLAGDLIDLPTAALAVFDVSITEWNERFGPNDVRLIDYARPKGLVAE